MLESYQSKDNAFMTLTYADDHLRVLSNGRATLVPKDAQDWLKRFRKKIEPTRVRYYLVGEYGDETQRPHYHVAMFGYATCRYGFSQYSRLRQNCCSQCDLVRETWGFGGVALGSISAESASYIAGYVTKKMTGKNDERLDGRSPEFARMSLRPAIGRSALHEIASTLMEFNLEETQGDVPSSLRHGSRLLPLGRYLRRELRSLVGMEKNAPLQTVLENEERLRELYQVASDAVASFPAGIRPALREVHFRNAIIAAADGAVARMETRGRIFKKGNKL